MAKEETGVMCRVNKDFLSEANKTKPKDVKYQQLNNASTIGECSLRCTYQTIAVEQPGCCEFRTSDGTCHWTGADGVPYLATEFRSKAGSTKNTRSILCTKGKWDNPIVNGCNSKYFITNVAFNISTFTYVNM